MKKTITPLLMLLLCLNISEINGQKKPAQTQCPVNSVNPEELDAGPGAGQVYPSISVSTLNNCTNYIIVNSYNWMSYVKNGLTVSVSVTNNSDYSPRAGCLIIGDYCVFVVQGCGVRPGNAGSISGSSSVCQGQTGVSYSVPAISGATGYVWSLPSGASITSGANTNNITVSFDNNASSGNITVYGTNTCNVGNGGISPNFPVDVRLLPVAPTWVSSSKTTVCQNEGGTMTLTAHGGSGTTLRWLTGSCASGATIGYGNSLVVSVPNSPPYTTYYARWETVCRNSACASVDVNCDATPVASISQQPDYALVEQQGITLFSHITYGVGPYDTYFWEGPNNWTSNDQNPYVGVYHQGNPLTYYLTYTSAHGCVSNRAWWDLHINYGQSPSIDSSNTEIKNDVNLKDLTIYPNPTTGVVNISSNQFDHLEVTVYNNMGKPLFKGFNVSTINLSKYVSGTYLIKLESNGKEITHIINLKK